MPPSSASSQQAPSSLPPSSQLAQSSSSAPSSSEASVPLPVTGPYDTAELPALYNFENPIPEEYTAELLDNLIPVGGGHTMASEAGNAYMAMFDAAAAEGVALTPVSGYRSNQQQSTNYNNSIQRYLNQGYSEAEATLLTQDYYAIPGTSEHEAGLAMDIGWIDDSFEGSAAFAWLQENAAEYGFILRYQDNTYETTHIRYEPWHYRFIGANYAQQYVELGMETLEDYTAWLQEQ